MFRKLILLNARKPKSFFGRIFIKKMNKGHRNLHAWAVSLLNKENVNNILDIGCGGGILIESLLKKFAVSKIYGIDYSELSVKKTTELNKNAVKSGRCFIQQADVAAIPFEDNKFDIITAFETIYFWQDIKKAFSEIYRVTAENGMFAVCNEASCRNDAKEADLLNMNVYTPEEIEQFMKDAGFSEINIQRHSNNIWCCITGKKFKLQ